MLAITAVLAGIATSASSSPAGLTGQGFLDANRAFAAGYAYGILDVQLNIVPNDGVLPEYQKRFRKCFVGSDFNSDNFYESVRRYIEQRPETLLVSALGAVINTIAAICPPQD